MGTIFATAPRNTHRAYSGAAILAGYVVKCVIESSQRAPRELWRTCYTYQYIPLSRTHIMSFHFYFWERTVTRVTASSSVTADMWVTVWTSDEISSTTRLESWQEIYTAINNTNGIWNSTRLFTAVEEVLVARLLSRARGLLLGTGSDMLKKSTKNTHDIL